MERNTTIIERRELGPVGKFGLAAIGTPEEFPPQADTTSDQKGPYRQSSIKNNQE